MMDESSVNFLVYYLQSLKERTREESSGTKFGIDWVVYNIAIQEGWTPYRLPFFRSGSDETSKTKTEAEFGQDETYLSTDRTRLRIFVVKDEVLNNRNWNNENFDSDLRMACSPDLRSPDLAHVTTVEVVLAYNKDEDDTGVRLFERFAMAMPSKIGDTAYLSISRWNLTTFVEKVQESLLSPALLPQKFFSQFSYIRSQVSDFEHGSDEWENQVIPNWRNFLGTLLPKNADERSVRLVPVSLIILKQACEHRETGETAWIDLMEWGMLAAWHVASVSTNEDVKAIIANLWIDFYVKEIERYYLANVEHLSVEQSIDYAYGGTFVGTIVSGVVAHWHLARLGLLSLAIAELLPDPESAEERKDAMRLLHQQANWTAGFLHANPSSMRPTIDLNHIELFLTWLTFRRIGRLRDMLHWFIRLTNGLTMRRFGRAQIPFIEGRNSLELVFESVATGETPPEFCDKSSTYLTCLLELACGSRHSERAQMVEVIYRRLVLARTDENDSVKGAEPLDLTIWFPPKDWYPRVLIEPLGHEGSCYNVELGNRWAEALTDGDEIIAATEQFVLECRAKEPMSIPTEVPMSVMILACLKHGTPLPPEFWRHFAFPKPEDDSSEPVGDATEG